MIDVLNFLFYGLVFCWVIFRVLVFWVVVVCGIVRFVFCVFIVVIVIGIYGVRIGKEEMGLVGRFGLFLDFA